MDNKHINDEKNIGSLDTFEYYIVYRKKIKKTKI